MSGSRQNFKETWTVTQPQPGRPSWEIEGPTITREVEGVGYQPAIGGHGGVSYIGQPAAPTGGRRSPHIQAYLDSIGNDRPARYLPEPLPIPDWMRAEGVLHEKIRLKKLEIELQELETNASPVPMPEEIHAGISPWFVIPFVVVGVGMWINGRLRGAPPHPRPRPEPQRT